jgi:hypothetical protein
MFQLSPRQLCSYYPAPFLFPPRTASHGLSAATTSAPALTDFELALAVPLRKNLAESNDELIKN